MSIKDFIPIFLLWIISMLILALWDCEAADEHFNFIAPIDKAVKDSDTITTYDSSNIAVTEQTYTSSSGTDTVNKSTDA